MSSSVYDIFSCSDKEVVVKLRNPLSIVSRTWTVLKFNPSTHREKSEFNYMIFTLCIYWSDDFLHAFLVDLLNTEIHRPTTQFKAMGRPTGTDFV
jgi:hypothetical protein